MNEWVRFGIGLVLMLFLIGFTCWLEYKARVDPILPPPQPDERDSIQRFHKINDKE